MIENRNVNIITDADGKKLVLINDIRFKGKRQIDWNDVKQYLEGYVGDYYEIEENAERIYIGNELPEEYAESESRKSLIHQFLQGASIMFLIESYMNKCPMILLQKLLPHSSILSDMISCCIRRFEVRNHVLKNRKFLLSNSILPIFSEKYTANSEYCYK